MIDTHMHVVNANLPGVPTRASLDGPIEPLAEAIRDEMKAAGIEGALGMPRWNAPKDDPLGINGTLRLATLIPGLHAVGIADPGRTDAEHLARVEAVLKLGKVKAFKGYLGYLHHGPDSPGYRPYLELARKYGLPMIFHTGDTFSHLAKLKYALPIGVDEAAVDHPEVNFVIAHCGNPWLIDAAEVIYKNNKRGARENVWADLSGLLVGTPATFEAYRKDGVTKVVAAEVFKAFAYTERPDRFLFGSDWPLAPLVDYRDFVRSIVPEEHHAAVFRDNAKALFKL